MAIMMRVRATLTYGTGGPGLYTSYWRPSTPGGSPADATDALGRVRAFFVGIAAQLPNSTAVGAQSDIALINDIDGALVGSLSPTPVAGVAGTGGASIAPLASMALVRLRTNGVVNGRIVRGRWYVGPLASTAVSAVGGIAAAAQTAINAAANAMLPAGATTTDLVVWHRPNGASPGEAVDVTTCSTWGELAVMRSRRDA